jgi:hypothetical protein
MVHQFGLATSGAFDDITLFLETLGGLTHALLGMRGFALGN